MLPVDPAASARPLTTPLVSLGAGYGWRELLLKDETKQRSGAFKFRGVWRRTGLLPCGTRLTTASTGNHASALALAARLRGQRARIFVPASTPRVKQDRIMAEGAELVVMDGGYDACEEQARRDADSCGAVFVHSFDDPEVIEGHRSLFREAAAQGGIPDVAYVPLGGGGLITAALREWAGVGVRVVGVEYGGAPAMARSLAAGRRIVLDTATGLPEGLLVRRIGRTAFDTCRRAGQRVVTVDDGEIQQAMRLLWLQAGVRAEGAGAAALAAALREGARGQRALAVVSGGNVDESVWRRCLDAAASPAPRDPAPFPNSSAAPLPTPPFTPSRSSSVLSRAASSTTFGSR